MEVTGWMMHMAKLAIIIFTITTTATTTLYVQLDNLSKSNFKLINLSTNYYSQEKGGTDDQKFQTKNQIKSNNATALDLSFIKKDDKSQQEERENEFFDSYRPLNDAYEPTATDLLMKRDYGDIPGVLRFGKRNYEIDPVYKKAAPNLLQLGDNVYDKKDVPGVLRFGKREGDIPGVLRFGKRDDNDIPGVLRFGKRSAPSLLRFGRR